MSECSDVAGARGCAGPLGAYGLRVLGLEGAERWMGPVAVDAPVLRVSVSVGAVAEAPTRVGVHDADVALIEGGRLRARRAADEVQFAVRRRPAADELLHPYLAPAAALAWQWRGQEALHGGAVQIGEVAVLLFGDPQAGKSTTLGWLAQRSGLSVLSDDLAVIVDGMVLAGPRSIDLRTTPPGAPELASVRGGNRARLQLAPAPPSAPAGGIVILGWGSALKMETVPPSQRLAAISRQRTFAALPANATALLELAALPMFKLTRPPDLDVLGHAAHAIVARFS